MIRGASKENIDQKHERYAHILSQNIPRAKNWVFNQRLPEGYKIIFQDAGDTNTCKDAVMIFSFQNAKTTHAFPLALFEIDPHLLLSTLNTALRHIFKIGKKWSH